MNIRGNGTLIFFSSIITMGGDTEPVVISRMDSFDHIGDTKNY